MQSLAFNVNIDSKINYPKLEFTAMPAISITLDTDFDLYAVSGNGSVTNPYIFEDFSFISTGYPAIYIHDTTKYFVIRNCLFDSIRRGIDLENIADSTGTIDNNTFVNIDGDAILLRYAPRIKIINNLIECDDDGISIGSSAYADIINNTFTNCGIGYNSYSSPPGVEKNYNVVNNTINGKKLAYYYNIDNLVFNTSDYGQIFLFYCDNAIIKNQYFTNIGFAIYLGLCVNFSISESTFFDTRRTSVLVARGYSSIIKDNYFESNSIGIEIHEKYFDVAKDRVQKKQLMLFDERGKYNAAGSQ